jgi:hypothetical protein
MITSGRIGVILTLLLACTCLSACREGIGNSMASRRRADTHGSLKQLIDRQPDFTAKESLHFPEQYQIKKFEGFSTSYSVSKKGLTYRRDRGAVISYEWPDKPALLFYPRSREYIESPRLGIWFENAFSPGLDALDAPNLVFEKVGETELDGHKCIKIKLSNKDDASATIIYYVAIDLQNLVIRIEFVDLFGTRTYTLKDISFDVPSELFQLPSGYKRSVADPTAEYRLVDHFQLEDSSPLTPDSFRIALLKKLPPGTPEEEVYRYLEERLVGKDRLSSYYRAKQDGRIVCRIEYDPTLPGAMKKHFGVIFLLDEERKLRGIHLNSWVSAP